MVVTEVGNIMGSSMKRIFFKPFGLCNPKCWFCWHSGCCTSLEYGKLAIKNIGDYSGASRTGRKASVRQLVLYPDPASGGKKSAKQCMKQGGYLSGQGRMEWGRLSPGGQGTGGIPPPYPSSWTLKPYMGLFGLVPAN